MAQWFEVTSSELDDKNIIGYDLLLVRAATRTRAEALALKVWLRRAAKLPSPSTRVEEKTKIKI
jgi:hypothetical protein